MREILNDKRRDYDNSRLESQAKASHCPSEFARGWNSAVAADLEREPLTEEEFQKLEAKDGARAVISGSRSSVACLRMRPR
ncbi:MAG: hypothetical protein WKF84_05985 [Pyrinomonadaceae bacterium]